ncbi:MAG: LysM peptidoglycan-binding domain-containing protein [Verrucomicrobia bacterium]|nr:LysM peptidoglycan-binding domain-containing protein [Verrucomicrobiota bacterium]
MCRILLIVSVIFCSACSSSDLSLVEETEERQFKLAKDFQSQGRYEDALITYLGLISVRRESPESHLEVGYIYLQTLKDPIRAIFHFDRYLELKPESERTIQVKQLIETAKLEFLRQLPTKPFQAEVDRIDLLEVIENLKKENDLLKLKYNQALLKIKSIEGQETMERVASSLNEMVPTEAVSNQDVPRLNGASRMLENSQSAVSIDPREVPKSYVVQPGDTLSKISEKFYGTANRWNDIYQANRDTLPSARSLKVGQELLIP